MWFLFSKFKAKKWLKYSYEKRFKIFVALEKKVAKKVIIEQSKERYELTKEDIENFFKYTIKEFPNQVFDYLVKFVRVYNGKIEIGLNYMLNPIESNNDQIIQKVFTETHETQRIFKGNSVKTKVDTYDIYIIL